MKDEGFSSGSVLLLFLWEELSGQDLLCCLRRSQDVKPSGVRELADDVKEKSTEYAKSGQGESFFPGGGRKRLL